MYIFNKYFLFSDSVSDSFTSSPSKKPKTDDIIDLTETDSEDDEPQPESSHNISSGCVSPPVISIDSPAGPQSVSSVSSVNSISSFDSPKRSASRSSSSFSPLSSSSSSNSSSRTVGYNPRTPQSPTGYNPHTPQSPNSPPISPVYNPRSPYKSPLTSPISQSSSSLHGSPMATPSSSSYLPPYPAFPPSFPMMSFPAVQSAINLEPVDREIEDFLQGLASDPFRWQILSDDLNNLF